MKHFKITIRVAYDEETVPSNMEAELKRNVDRCVQRSELLNDQYLQAELEEWRVDVENVTEPE